MGCAFRSRGWWPELLSSECMFSRLWRFELLHLSQLHVIWRKYRASQSLGWITWSDWSLSKALQSLVVLWGQAFVLWHSLKRFGRMLLAAGSFTDSVSQMCLRDVNVWKMEIAQVWLLFPRAEGLWFAVQPHAGEEWFGRVPSSSHSF